MNYKKKSSPTFRAEITLGLNKGYAESQWSLQELKSILTKAQEKLKLKTGTLLSAKVTLCDIVFLGQDEKSATFSFINYPRFPLEYISFKEGVLFVGQELMNQLEQNRIVMVFEDETVLFEKSIDVDPRINHTAPIN